MELGFHLANLSFTGGAPALRPTIARVAREVEAAGVQRLTVMDHVWQIRGYGPPENNMLEGYTLLGFLAAHTEKVLLHTLVTGVVYREPGLLAKEISTLDVLSGGRAALGIGAAWNEEESHGLGLPFPPITERFERLEEALKIFELMWSNSEEPFEGTYYSLGRTLNVPQLLNPDGTAGRKPYTMIGGVGEKKTLRLVAQYADACNLFAAADPERKLAILREHCDAVGRDYDTIEKTSTWSVGPETTREELLATLEPLRALGVTATYISSRDPEPLRSVELLASVVDELAAW